MNAFLFYLKSKGNLIVFLLSGHKYEKAVDLSHDKSLKYLQSHINKVTNKLASDYTN